MSSKVGQKRTKDKTTATTSGSNDFWLSCCALYESHPPAPFQILQWSNFGGTTLNCAQSPFSYTTGHTTPMSRWSSKQSDKHSFVLPSGFFDIAEPGGERRQLRVMLLIEFGRHLVCVVTVGPSFYCFEWILEWNGSSVVEQQTASTFKRQRPAFSSNLICVNDLCGCFQARTCIPSDHSVDFK